MEVSYYDERQPGKVGCDAARMAPSSACPMPAPVALHTSLMMAGERGNWACGGGGRGGGHAGIMGIMDDIYGW